MKEQEQEHLETFNKLIVEKRVRPTALLPLWNVAGFALGRYKIQDILFANHEPQKAQ